jgi:hypothetical protein
MFLFWFVTSSGVQGNNGASQNSYCFIFKSEDMKMETVCSFETVIYLEVHMALQIGRLT